MPMTSASSQQVPAGRSGDESSATSSHIASGLAESAREASDAQPAGGVVDNAAAAALRAVAASRQAAPASLAAQPLSPPQRLHPLAAGFYGAAAFGGAGHPRSPFKLACPPLNSVQHQLHSVTAANMSAQPTADAAGPSSASNPPASSTGQTSIGVLGQAGAPAASTAASSGAATTTPQPAGQSVAPGNAAAQQPAQTAASAGNAQATAPPASWRSLLEQRRGPVPSATANNPASRFRPPGFQSNNGQTAQNTTQPAASPAAATSSPSTPGANKPGGPSDAPANPSAANSAFARPPSYSPYGAGFGPRRPFDGWGRSAASAYGASSQSQQPTNSAAAAGSTSQDAAARPPNAGASDATQGSAQQAGSSSRPGPGSPHQQQRSPVTVGGSAASTARAGGPNATNTTGRNPVTGATLVSDKDRIGGAANASAAGSLYGASYGDRLAQQQRERDRLIQARAAAGDSRSPPIASRTGISSLFGSHGSSNSASSSPAQVKASSASPTVPPATAPGPANKAQGTEHKRPHSLSHSSADKDRPAMPFGWSNSPGSNNVRARDGAPMTGGANESRTASASQSPFGSSAATATATSAQNPPTSAPGTGHFRGASMPGNVPPGPATSTGAYGPGSSGSNAGTPRIGAAGLAGIRNSYLYHGGQRAAAGPPNLPPVGTGASSASPGGANTSPAPGSATVSRTAGTGLGLTTSGTLAGTAAAIEKDRERENQAASLANNWRQHPQPPPMSAHPHPSIPPTPASALHIPPYGATAAARKQEQASPQLQQRPAETVPSSMQTTDREPVGASWRDGALGQKRKRSDDAQPASVGRTAAGESATQQAPAPPATTPAQIIPPTSTPAAPQLEQATVDAQPPTAKRRSGPLFGPEDVKGAALRPPLMAVRSDLVVRALHKISHQQTVASGTMHTPPFLGRFVYDPFIDPAVLLDADLMKRGVGGKAEIWLDTNWLRGEIWEAGAPAHPAASRATSPSTDKPEEAVPENAEDADMEAEETADKERLRNADDPAWTLWDLPPLRSRKIWGTDVYTDDSDILAACIHSGWLRLGSTAPLFSVGKSDAESTAPGTQPAKKARKARKASLPKQRSLKITIVVAPRLIKYEGSLRAGVRSRSWGNSHDGVSFAIESVELVEDTVHRFGRSRLKNLTADFGNLAKERCACYSGCDHRYMHPPLQLGRLLVKAT